MTKQTKDKKHIVNANTNANTKASAISPQAATSANISSSNISAPNATTQVSSDRQARPNRPIRPKKLRDYVFNPEYRTNIPLILMMFIFVVFGLLILYSVSAPIGFVNSDKATSTYYVFRQLAFSAFGITVALVLMFVPIDLFRHKKLSTIIVVAGYIVCFLLLIIVRFFGVGSETQGAGRWVEVGPITIQPSEIVKLYTVYALAWYRNFIEDLKAKGKLQGEDAKSTFLRQLGIEFFVPVFAIVILAVLILIQPHFSCFILLAIVTFVCIATSGIKPQIFFTGVLIILTAIGLVVGTIFAIPPVRENVITKVQTDYAHVFKRFEIYARERGAETDLTEDDTRQVDRALNAIGTGDMFGVGFGNSRSKYFYVSEPHNDYIFSIYIEETGFVGGVTLITAYLVFFALGMREALRAKSTFARTIIVGFSVLITMQALINIAVTLVVVPPTGITLPFVSYGGTAQILLLTCYGMLLSATRSGVKHPPLVKEVKSNKDATKDADGIVEDILNGQNGGAF